MEKLGIVYSFTNKINGKRYIGQTINPKSRYIAHINDSNNPNSQAYNYPLAKALRKYGLNNFVYEVLGEELTIDEMNELEIYYIDLYDSINNGYNILEGGRNASRIHSDEAKAKMSEAKGELSVNEIINLRIAYRDHSSPTKIYKELYQDKMHFNSFLNIWTGQRYKHIMPEVFDRTKNRRIKYNEETVSLIRELYAQEDLSYDKLSKMFNIPKSTIVDFIKRRTWKHIP
jgi:group I intron endonuclease